MAVGGGGARGKLVAGAQRGEAARGCWRGRAGGGDGEAGSGVVCRRVSPCAAVAAGPLATPSSLRLDGLAGSGASVGWVCRPGCRVVRRAGEVGGGWGRSCWGLLWVTRRWCPRDRWTCWLMVSVDCWLVRRWHWVVVCVGPWAGGVAAGPARARRGRGMTRVGGVGRPALAAATARAARHGGTVRVACAAVGRAGDGASRVRSAGRLGVRSRQQNMCAGGPGAEAGVGWCAWACEAGAGAGRWSAVGRAALSGGLGGAVCGAERVDGPRNIYYEQ